MVKFLQTTQSKISGVALAAFIFLMNIPQALAASKVDEGLNTVRNQFDTQGKLTGATSVGGLIEGIIYMLLTLLLTVAMLFIIIGGYQYITSRGNEDQAKSGRRTLTYAIIGLIVVILSYVIVNVVARTVQN